jgi:Zn-finger nucleic acid-binding protein
MFSFMGAYVRSSLLFSQQTPGYFRDSLIAETYQENEMKCPHCTDTTLVMTERQGVEIDYCPDCRGIWLDRGELDKLLDKVSGPSPAVVSPERAGRAPQHRDFGDSDFHEYKRNQHSRKKSWLHEIFD